MKTTFRQVSFTLFPSLLILVICLGQALAQSSPTETKKTEVISYLGKLPALFIENQGQTAEEVRYYFKGKDSIYFTDEGVVFQKTGASENVGATRRVAQYAEETKGMTDVGARRAVPLHDGGGENVPDESCLRQIRYGEPARYTSQDGKGEGEHAQSLSYRLEFVGANPASPQARNALQGKVNYFIGSDPSKWHSDIPTYQEIVYPGLYTCHSERSEESTRLTPSPLPSPAGGEGTLAQAKGFSCHSDPERSEGEESLGKEPRPFAYAQGDTRTGIDLVYRGVPGGMKYEFIVQPGANPDDIRLAYTGIESLSIDESGNLIIHTALGEVKD
ncbi:MAG TPA: DUF7948 domain-containing protein, partial [Candidatus Hypogeohydataceae bacterium YC40]